MTDLGVIDDLESALSSAKSYDAPPEYVDPDDLSILDKEYLDEDVIADLRQADPKSTRRKLYMTWRRQKAVRLHAQGLTYAEIAPMLGVSEATIGVDVRSVRAKYENVAKRDWALLVEERIYQIDSRIYDLNRMYEGSYDTAERLSILDRIKQWEDKRDKMLGLDKAAASQFDQKKEVKVTLSFGNEREVDQPALDDGVIDVG